MKRITTLLVVWCLGLLVTASACLALLAIPTQAQTRAYVTNVNSNSVSVIDTASNTVVATVGVGSNPVGVAITPGVGPPTNKDQCKKGGWETFTIPQKFKNQGDCVSFVNTGK
jgi:YVTN family beta-propeller protein